MNKYLTIFFKFTFLISIFITNSIFSMSIQQPPQPIQPIGGAGMPLDTTNLIASPQQQIAQQKALKSQKRKGNRKNWNFDFDKAAAAQQKNTLKF